MNMNELVTL